MGIKNTKGGNRSKGMARKYATARARDLRMSTCELEQYGAVTRVLGHGMFYVTTTHHTQLLGHIRNKFKGRFKRDNQVTSGALVLVGLRDWEAPHFKECDLLEVYDANETRLLLNNPAIDLQDIHTLMLTSTVGSAEAAAAVTDGGIDFCDNDGYEEDALEMEASTEAAAAAAATTASYMEDMVAFDDI